MKIKCLKDGWLDITKGKHYEVDNVDSKGNYWIYDDVRDRTVIDLDGVDDGEWEVVGDEGGGINTSDLTMNIQWRDMEFSVENLAAFHDINNAINTLRKHLKG